MVIGLCFGGDRVEPGGGFVVAEPGAVISRLFTFLDLEPATGDWRAQPGLNRRYLKRWKRIPLGPLTRPVWPAGFDDELEGRVRRFGYSLRRREELFTPEAEVGRRLVAPG